MNLILFITANIGSNVIGPINKKVLIIESVSTYTSVLIKKSFIKQGLGIYTTEYSRMQASMALGSLGTGQLALMGIIMCSSYIYLFKNISFLKKISVCFIAFLSVLILLRSGSRGPLLILIVLFSIILFSRIKNKIISLSIISLFCLVGYILYDYLQLQ